MKLKTIAKDTYELVKDAGIRWSDDHAAQLGAALAYYAIFAVGPLLLIAISVAGLVFGKDAAQNHILETLRSYIGTSGAATIQEIVAKSAKPSSGIAGTLIGAALLLFGATGLFGQLDDALNIIWRIKPSTEAGWKQFLKQRFLSLSMVLGSGFLLLVSLVLSTVLAIIGKFFSDHLPGGITMWKFVNFGFSFCVITAIFAIIFKIVPRARLAWGDVWRGALITGSLFTLGKFLLGIYIEKGAVGSAYGAAGSLIGVLVWIYYAAQILFFGAELTQVYAERFGSRAPGEENAPATASPDKSAADPAPAV